MLWCALRRWLPLRLAAASKCATTFPACWGWVGELKGGCGKAGGAGGFPAGWKRAFRDGQDGPFSFFFLGPPTCPPDLSRPSVAKRDGGANGGSLMGENPSAMPIASSRSPQATGPVRARRGPTSPRLRRDKPPRPTISGNPTCSVSRHYWGRTLSSEKGVHLFSS
jgi:hypothetical protein